MTQKVLSHRSAYQNKFALLILCVFTVTSFAKSPNIYGPYMVNFEYAPTYYHYQEKVYNPDTGGKEYFMSLTSAPVIHSLTTDFRRYIDNNWFTKSLVTIVLGNVNYNSDGSGYVNGEDNLIFMFDNSIHYCRDNTLCASLGYAFRYLDNDSGLSVTSTGNTGYERENFLHLVPVEMSYRYRLMAHRFSSMQFFWKYYYMLDGWQVSHISNYSGCDADLKNKQNTGYGLETSLRLYSIDRKWFYGAKLQYWKIDASDEVLVPCFGSDNVGSEPENTTFMFGITAGYHYL